MRSEEIQQSLDKLASLSAEIEGVALVDDNGFIIASHLPEALDEDRVAALTAAFQGIASRCSEELGKGKPAQFFLQTDSGYMVVMGVGENACLAVVSSRYAKPGMLLLDLKNTTEEIGKLL